MKKMIISLLALLAIATTAEAQVEINETNFKDQKFRNYVSNNYDKDKNGTLSTEEIAAVKEMNLFNKSITSLKGIEFFTELQTLNCLLNQLTELDISQNKKLYRLECAANRLTALDVSKNDKLNYLLCCNNRINGEAMQTLVDGLNTIGGSKYLYIIDPSSSGEQNVITKKQVKIATSKNWQVYSMAQNGSTQPYEGSDDTPTGIGSVESGQSTVDSWYSIDGKKLNGEPTKTGVYIKNGKKVVK